MGNPATHVGNGVTSAWKISPEAVWAHLQEIVESPPMRASRRSCEFLEYVVARTLAGELDLLKERAIGEHVFHRPADYDTGQDSIVRGKANEVRRRLGQFYDLNPHSPIRFELPAGSYAVQIHETAAAGPPSPSPAAEVRRRPYGWIVGGMLLAAAALSWFVHIRVATPFRTFWAVFIGIDRNVLLCLPTPEVYRIYGSGKGEVVEALRPRPPGEPRLVPEEAALRRTTIVSEPRLFLGQGDARAMTLVYSLLAGMDRRPMMRLGTETTFAELRSAPAIIIGGWTNPWSRGLADGGRFAFAESGYDPGIVDTQTGKFVCLKESAWQSNRNVDCAIVMRLMNSKTGHPVLVAAGLHHYGTLAVGEFLTRQELLEPALQAARADWAQKNLQIVFQIEVVRDDVGPPKVLGTHVW